ncbi:DNA polymerase IV [Pseudohongiella spirulinae]|uniref:DNA polymerase IV n=1 Tax=Pseudohongiella spirulinae TaxID=1249552 RepID=A0A0S2KAA7_9GAMM|nr:DNA polymerase IV [Pseudohongiella spirulinae]ALO45022.1 DNA polymerase IV [Pseudohongiella spirulinae]
MTAIPVRKIIHCDCDCFYAAIEMRDNPQLRGRPLAVGGASERRGVVATCNYEARQFGIHSAMPTATALRRCPELLVVPPRMDKYRQVSRQVQAVFRDYTDLIEPLSLDEAYLDVSQSGACQGSATLMAQQIRDRVRDTLGITLSAGIAPNKFLAKIASDWNKPDGQYVIRPAQVDEFVRQLPVSKLFGVGKVTASRLHAMGVITCEDLRAYSQAALQAQFGSFGQRLYLLARGIDDREVKVERQRKSLSVENTYAVDLPGLPECLDQISSLYEQMLKRWQGLADKYQVAGCFVKLKFNNFASTTAEQAGRDMAPENFPALMEQAWQRYQLPVRLVGLGVRLRPRSSAVGADQLSLTLE